MGIITVGPRYFETEGIPFLLGRDISTHDGSGSPMVAVVNESFARYFLSAEDPIGKRFALGSPYEGPGIEIVGIVKDAKFDSVREKPSPIAFLPVLQMQGDDRYVGEIELRASGDL